MTGTPHFIVLSIYCPFYRLMFVVVLGVESKSIAIFFSQQHLLTSKVSVPSKVPVILTFFTAIIFVIVIWDLNVTTVTNLRLKAQIMLVFSFSNKVF